LNTLSLTLNLASVACGLGSAAFWFMSTRISWPNTTHDGGQAQIKAMLRQSALSGWGAVLAAASVSMLAIDNVLKLLLQ